MNVLPKLEEIPLEFRLKNKAEIEEILDSQTPYMCFCGRLATGLHTSTCKRYQSKFNSILRQRYKQYLKDNK